MTSILIRLAVARGIVLFRLSRANLFSHGMTRVHSTAQETTRLVIITIIVKIHERSYYYFQDRIMRFAISYYRQNDRNLPAQPLINMFTPANMYSNILRVPMHC